MRGESAKSSSLCLTVLWRARRILWTNRIRIKSYYGILGRHSLDGRRYRDGRTRLSRVEAVGSPLWASTRITSRCVRPILICHIENFQAAGPATSNGG
jgi:hypothetical protein